MAKLGIAAIAVLVVCIFILEWRCREWTEKHRKWIMLGVFVLYAAANILSALHHEYWRDEAQAWCLVRDSSIKDIFAQLKIEGHPALWFLVLLPFAKAGCSIKILSFITLMIILLAAWLLLKQAGFPLWIKTLILFSSVMLYYNAVITRIYALIVLVLFGIAASYKSRIEHPFRYCLLIFLLCQTHIIMAGLAIMLWLLYMEELIEQRQKIKNWLCSFLVPVSLVLVVLELMGSGRTSGSGIFSKIFSDFGASINEFFIQTSLTIGMAIGHMLPGWLFYVLLILAVICIVYLFPKYWRELLILAGGVGAQIFIAAFVYATIKQRAIIAFATVVFCYWICDVRKQENTERLENQKLIITPSESHIRKRISVVIQCYLSGLLVVACALSFVSTYQAMIDDYRRAYSGAEEMAGYIRNHLPEDAVIVSNVGVNTTAISGFDPEVYLWDPATNSRFSFVDWTKGGFDCCTSYADIRDRSIKKFGSTDQVYFLMNRAWVPADMDYDELELLLEQEPSIIEDEYFSLYQFK